MTEAYFPHIFSAFFKDIHFPSIKLSSNLPDFLYYGTGRCPVFSVLHGKMMHTISRIRQKNIGELVHRKAGQLRKQKHGAEKNLHRSQIHNFPLSSGDITSTFLAGSESAELHPSVPFDFIPYIHRQITLCLPDASNKSLSPSNFSPFGSSSRTFVFHGTRIVKTTLPCSRLHALSSVPPGVRQ